LDGRLHESLTKDHLRRRRKSPERLQDCSSYGHKAEERDIAHFEKSRQKMQIISHFEHLDCFGLRLMWREKKVDDS
jgi:hypothetical protein